MEHVPVMVKELVEVIAPRPGQKVVDCTFGRGGHAAAVLALLGGDGCYAAIDRDPEAMARAREIAAGDPRVIPVPGLAGDVESIVADLGWTGFVDSVFADLGVSSPQLDSGVRGFSFSADAPLDMRMDPETGMSAADWIRDAPEAEMARVFRELGEERFARRIARAIQRARQRAPIQRTSELAEVVARAHPAWERRRHPATRVFQAIRIHINDELNQLRSCFVGAARVLRPAGRLAFISFHSLEDRIVKRAIRDASRPPDPFAPMEVRERPVPRLRPLGRDRRPSDAEVARNPRARSAVLRAGERLEAAA